MKKHLILFLLFINLAGFFFSIFWSIKIIRAQTITPTQNASANAKPRPHVPCSETGETSTNLFTSNYPIAEFHSLRPYQASPCIENTPQSQMALYCGNDIVLEDSAEISFQFDTGIFKLFPSNTSVSPNINPERCQQNTGAGTQTCTFLISRDRNISINLSGLDLPVLGNTQNVRNSYKNTFKEEIDHAQKVNNYLTWYLSGVTYKPEYFYPFPNLLDYATGLLFENTDSFKKIIDYSGPLNKMLPQRIQYLTRERQINAAVQATSGRTINNSEDSFSPPTPRHNQVVICSLGINLTNLGLGAILPVSTIENFPIPCNLITTGNTFWDNFLNVVGPIRQRGLRIGYWTIDQRKPPKEENYITENPEDANQKFMEYVIATNEWRGQICSHIKFPSTGEPLSQIVPSFLRGVGFYLCYDNPANITQFEPSTRVHGGFEDEFFQHIPMSSTEDRIGEYALQVSRDKIEQEENVQIKSRALRGRTSSTLYLPHLQQSEELAEILQSTYVPYDLAKNAPALEKDVFRDVFLSGNTDVSNKNFGSCQALEYRDGPLGDNVFADSFNTTFSYQAEVTCEFPLPLENPTSSCLTLFQNRCGEMGIDCNAIASLTCAPPGYRCRTVIDPENLSCNDRYTCGINCEPSTENLSCKFTTSHVIDVNTSSPLLDSIWARIVAGPTSILRRMLPKLGEDSVITQFWDMPGASYASYFSSDEGTKLMMGDFRSNIDPSKAHVYFPHLGGIYHYFLEGLQTSLRPEGFGGKFLSPASTSSIRNPITITTCSQENSQNNQQEPSGNQATREEILQLISNYGLPLPNPNDSQIEGRSIRGYQTLFLRLDKDTNARKSTSELLKAEQELKISYPLIRRYLTTAWIWYETGSSYWPDPYLYNCDDGENAPSGSPKIDYAWSISRFCALDEAIQGRNADFLIQVAGFQATETRKKYRDAFIALYGNDNEKLREILRQVVINSNSSTRPSYWSYNHPNQNKQLVQEFLSSLNPNSSNPVTLNDILNQGRTWNTTDNQIETRRKQFFTFMLSKDPKMAIYLNTNGYGGGVTDGNIVRSSYGKQLLSNMIYALWMFESTLGRAENMPSEGSRPIRQIEDVCLEKTENIPVNMSIKDPIVSANDINVYLSYNHNSQAILKTKPVKNISFDNNTINVGVGRGSAPDFLTTHTYVGNGNIYYVWTDQSNPRKILFKKAPLSNVNSITNVDTVTVANSTTGLINHPRIVSNGKFLVVVWNEADDGASANFVRYSFSENDGQTWSPSEKASPYRIYGKEKPDLATSKDGDISLVYGGAISPDKNIGDIIMLYFNEETKFFDLQLPVALGKGGAFDYADPNHVYTTNGKIFIAFRDIGFIGEKGISRIYLASKNVSSASSEWKIETISDSTNVWGKPSISTDTFGGIHVFWASGYEQTVFYAYKHPSANWSRVYKIPEQYFVANADNSASVTDNEIIVHGIVEEHNQTSKPKYYIIKVKK